MNIVWISKITMDTIHKTSRLKMSDALRKRGHNVTLCMIKKFGEEVFSSDEVIYIPTINFPILSGFFYGLIVFFYFPIFLSRKNVDVIIIDCTKVWLPFVMPLKILNIPLILDIRTLPVERDDPFFSKVSIYLSRYIFKVSIYLSRYVVDGITTITPELKTILKDVYNLKNKKVGIWSSGASIEDFNKSDKKNIIRIKSTNHKFTLIYHGGYGPTRGIENLIKAVSELDSSIKNKIRLLIIGMPTNKINDLSKLSEKEGVKEQVNIFPSVEYSKIAQYLRMADVGIFCLSLEYIWWRVSAPLKTLEYLAAEKPIIVTNIPFHRRIFDKGNCGILLESNAPKFIAEGICYMYKNRKHLKKIGREGRKIVEKFYTWDCMAQKFEDFLITLLSGSQNDTDS